MLSTIKSLGSINLANKVAAHTESCIPAYQQFLKDQNFNNPEVFHARPLMEKTNYIDKYEYNSLLIPNKNNIVSFHRSSGFSQKSTYWPCINDGTEFLPQNKTIQSLQALYNIEKNKIMHMVLFSLGSWAGGDAISAKLKTICSEFDCPSMVYAPGKDYRDSIETIMQFQNTFDFFIIYITPSSISDFLMMAQSMKQNLPFDKIKFIVGGEMFPENLRTQICQNISKKEQPNAMLSIYGAADTCVMGMESPFSAAMRQVLQNDAIRKEFGITDGIPLLHHQLGENFYAETVDGQLIMTLWQGIPLIRYNLKDRVDLFSWKDLKKAILSFKNSTPEYESQFNLIENAPDNLPDIIAVYGRADRGIIVSGTNISENILNQAIRASVNGITQGKYDAQVIYGNHNNQRLSITIEVPNLSEMTSDLTQTVQKNIAKNICALHGEFEHDYAKHFYVHDDDPERSIVTVTFVQWPYFSSKNEGRIKHKIVN